MKKYADTPYQEVIARNCDTCGKPMSLVRMSSDGSVGTVSGAHSRCSQLDLCGDCLKWLINQIKSHHIRRPEAESEPEPHPAGFNRGPTHDWGLDPLTIPPSAQ